jgi:hypothetical protein
VGPLIFSSSSKELELYERCSPHHPCCHHLRSEQVELEDMDMPEVESMNMVGEQNHPTNHRWGKEDIHMVGSHMVEVEGMDTVVEHYHLMNHRPEVPDIDTVEDHYHSMNHRPEVEGMDREDSGMGDDMMVEVEVVGREPEDMVLVRHWTGDGAMRHQ